MGLFGYGKKDYRKNSAEIGKRIDQIYIAAAIKNMKPYPSAAVVSAELGTVYPVGVSGKVLAQTDARINSVLDMMDEDLKENRIFSVNARVCILLSLIKENRSLGTPIKDYCTSFEDRFVECGERISQLITSRDDLLTKIQSLQKKMKETEDTVLSAHIGVMVNQYGMVMGELKPYIGQLNSFVDQLEVCSRGFGKVLATPESIKIEDLWAVLAQEVARIG